jgi:hypothetical protein
MLRITFIFCLLISTLNTQAQGIKPYVLALESTEKINIVKDKMVSNLKKNGIEIEGQYQPANDLNNWILIVTSKELIDAVSQIGGLTAFASTLRIGISSENGKTSVIYTYPQYWGNSYFQNKFDSVLINYDKFSTKLIKSFKETGNFIGKPIGSNSGISIKELRKYRYSSNMPSFDETIELEEFESHDLALSSILKSIRGQASDISVIYKISIPNQELVLFGFALSGENGEATILKQLEQENHKNTIFFPYEVLVMGKTVHILNPEYRIPISFPDLNSNSLNRILPLSKKIHELLDQVIR